MVSQIHGPAVFGGVTSIPLVTILRLVHCVQYSREPPQPSMVVDAVGLRLLRQMRRESS